MHIQMMMGFVAMAIALGALCQVASAGTYYVSNAGSDEAPGTDESQPLRRIAEAAGRVRPGDRILLRRGDVFRESAEIPVRHVEVNAYGPPEADPPAISGSVELTGWRRHQGAIYVSNVEHDIGYLFVDGTLMTIARYPNEGWLRTKVWRELNPVRRRKGIGRMDRERGGGGPIVLVCPELAEHPRNADDYWVGASIRWRHHSWWYETRPIVEYKASGELTLGDVSDWVTGPFDWDEKGWGFYLDGKLEELDKPGECYFDAEEGKVYLWAPEGADPNELLVEASLLSSGLKVRDAVVKNVCFRHQKDIGLEIAGRCVVKGCRFESIGRDAPPSEFDAGGAALKAGPSVRDARVVRNQFRGNLNLGITWHEAPEAPSSSVIERNELTDTGMVAGYGGSGLWHAVPIRVVSGAGVHVRHNRITRSGYSGILFLADGNFAEYNVVKAAVSTTNDGAGIMTNASGSTFRHNIVLDCKGEMESSGTWKNLAQGIWLDCYPEDNRGQLVEGNTVAGSGACGLFVRNNHDCLIRDNVFYDNGSQMVLTGSGQLIVNNVFCALQEGQSAIRYEAGGDFGTLKDNYLSAPSTGKPLQEMGGGPALSVSQWQQQCPWADRTARTDTNRARGRPELFINDGDTTRTIPMEGAYRDLNGRTVTEKIELEPFSGRVLVRVTED